MERLEEIQTRMEAIKSEAAAEGADLDALETETRALAEERKVLMAQVDAEIEMREAVAAGENITAVIAEKTEEKRMNYAIDSAEYRSAFYANLFGNATPEQRAAIAADNSAYGDGVALPTSLDTMIWDQIYTEHPILADVNTVRSGMVLKVTRATPAAISGKKDSAANTDQTVTLVDVNLVGKDYTARVPLTYAEAKMSQGAMEQYLANEVATAVGAALAGDVFARILSDAGTSAKVTATSNMFTDLNDALGKASTAVNAVIYAAPADYYKIFGAVDSNGQPIFRDGIALGAQVKKDAAATKITVVDPSHFVLNIIQDTTVESFKDVPNTQFVITGYCRAEGCLRKTKSAAYISAT